MRESMFFSSQKGLHRPKTCQKGENKFYFFITYQAKVFGSHELITHVLDLAVHDTKTGYNELFSNLTS